MDDPRGQTLIARTGELDRLATSYATAASGSSRTVVVAGEAGIGKTRLTRTFSDWVEGRGGRVLTGGCLPLRTGDLPYGPFVEAFRGLLQGLDAAALPAVLGPNRRELARLMPELRPRPDAPDGVHRHPGGVPDDGDLAPGDDRFAQVRLFELVLGVLDRLAARSPVVLVIEDIHWADPSTLDLLAFLVRNLGDEAVLVVATVRSDELDRDDDAQTHLAELERLDTVERIDLPRLGHDDLGRLVADELGGAPDPDLVERIWRRSGGNPFYAEQIIAATSESADGELPPRLRDVVLGRVATISETGQAILRIASAAGSRIDDGLLAEVADLARPALHEALREVTQRRILDHAGGGDDPHLVFRHALLREVVYGELFAAERVRLHERFAMALEGRAADRAAGRGSRGPSPSAAELAYHWDAAGDDRRALTATIEAGRAAERAYAWLEANRHYVRALALCDRLPATQALATERVGVLARAAETAVLIGAPDAAVDLGRQAIGAVDPAVDPALAGALHERLRWYLWESGDRAAAAAAVEEAERLIPGDPPSTARARVLAHRAAILMGGGAFAASAAVAEEAIDIARTVGSASDEALALGILGWDLALLGRVDEGVERVRAAVAIAEAIDNAEGIALGATNLAVLLDRVGRTAEALEVAGAGWERMRELGVERTYGGLLLAVAAKTAIALGRWDEADAILSAGLGRNPVGPAAIRLRIQRARLDTWRGNVAAAADGLARARAAMAGPSPSEDRAALLAAEAELAAIRDLPSEARSAVDEGFALAADGLPDPALASLAATGLRVEADAAAGARARRDDAAVEVARARAARIAAQVHRIAALLGARVDGPATEPSRTRAVAAQCLAELHRLESADAADEWLAVAASYDAIARPYAAAYGRYRAAAAGLRDRGDRAAARRALATARSTAAALGAQPLLAEIDHLARQARLGLEPDAGAAPRDRAGDRPSDRPDFGLTDRELEVLRLIAGGWSNQQIATALFISRKTASVHASHIFDKLGAANRAEAAAMALRVGLVEDPPPPGSLLSG